MNHALRSNRAPSQEWRWPDVYDTPGLMPLLPLEHGMERFGLRDHDVWRLADNPGPILGRSATASHGHLERVGRANWGKEICTEVHRTDR
jgi:hypothetical protein